MKGGEAIVNSLLSHNVDTFFGLPGVQTYEIFDALYTHSDKVTLYVPKHEQTAGYMAYGYAKSGAGAGIFSVVPGPGVLNAGAALCTAQGASAPVMCITGQVPSGFLGKGYGHLHELPDQLATVGSFTKSARRIEHGAQAPALVNDAFEQMTTGRPGAVHLEMTWDELSRTSSVLISESGIHERSVAIPEAFDVENAIELIKESKFPMLFVGGGATGACEEIQELANLLEIPVVAHRAGRGVVSESEDLGLFGYAGRLLWEHVDLVIAIGTRLEMPYLRWQQYDRYSPRPSYPKLVRIDIDPMEHVRWPADVAITADAKVAVAALLSEVKAGGIASFRLAAAARKAKEIA
ncbi:MAG: thiamine pyrophosphate-binding protein, partial [Lacipirellulaceae bacterium]